MMSSVNPIVNSQATPASGQTGFAATENEAQLYVDIFNSFLQDSPAPTSALTAPGASSSSLLLQLLNSQQASKTSSGNSLSDSLTAIGIGFQQPSTLNATGQLTLDAAKLQAAYNADQSGTQAAVSQAVQSIGQLAENFSGSFVPDFSTSNTNASVSDLFSSGGQSTTDGLLGGFDSSSDNSSIFDTFSQSPQLEAAEILGTVNTSGTTPSLPDIFSQGGQSTAADLLNAFDSSDATSPIFDLFSQSPQLEAEAILGTLPQVPKTPTA